MEKLVNLRPVLSFPEYQRQPNLWPDEKKALLIDSILRDLDIPKLYFNKIDGGYEVVDGQQRLWAIWDFLADSYGYKTDSGSKRFSKLSPTQRSWITGYKLQVTLFDEADEDYLRELFLRLQLGLLLITGEKLHAATGMMRDFVFKTLVKHPFLEKLGIPSRRFAKETLGAQICLNSFSIAKLSTYARTRFEDLQFFFREYQNPGGEDLAFFRERQNAIVGTLSLLESMYAEKSAALRNRSYILSLYLFIESRLGEFISDEVLRKHFVRFSFVFWDRLKMEAKAGMDRSNRELYSFETMLSSAPGERYQIERRQGKLEEYFDHYLRTKRIKGDPLTS